MYKINQWLPWVILKLCVANNIIFKLKHYRRTVFFDGKQPSSVTWSNLPHLEILFRASIRVLYSQYKPPPAFGGKHDYKIVPTTLARDNTYLLENRIT